MGINRDRLTSGAHVFLLTFVNPELGLQWVLLHKQLFICGMDVAEFDTNFPLLLSFPLSMSLLQHLRFSDTVRKY